MQSKETVNKINDVCKSSGGQYCKTTTIDVLKLAGEREKWNVWSEIYEDEIR